MLIWKKRGSVTQKYIKTISYKTLSATLKELEADNRLHREEYPQIPPKVEYSLTKRGKSLIPILDQMCEWGEKTAFEIRFAPFLEKI